MSGADHFGNNHQVQPGQDLSQMIMEICDVGSSTAQDRHGGEAAGDPRMVLTYLTFLEQKIGHLRGIICSTPHPPPQIVSAELTCIVVQLVSISKNLAGNGEEADAMHEGSDGDEGEQLLPRGSYEVVQIAKEEILASHVHFCEVCGKGFKRDANLRMHMRGHGDEYKTAAALAKPGRGTSPDAARRCLYSCPFVGCKRNREHKSFLPLKTPICVKNHYRRSHCDKSFTCRRCNVKKFSVLADLRTHEKHCGRDRWVCSCGTSFSRKDKLFGHVAVFDGHTPAMPPDEYDDEVTTAAGSAGMSGSGQLLHGAEALNRAVDTDQCFSESMFDDFRCSDIKGSMDDERGYLLPPMGLDSCGFDGFDLFGVPAFDF
ncbi:hypothetical protein ABZP36_004542 [Zizania latifolia]